MYEFHRVVSDRANVALAYHEASTVLVMNNDVIHSSLLFEMVVLRASLDIWDCLFPARNSSVANPSASVLVVRRKATADEDLLVFEH